MILCSSKTAANERISLLKETKSKLTNPSVVVQSRPDQEQFRGVLGGDESKKTPVYVIVLYSRRSRQQYASGMKSNRRTTKHLAWPSLNCLLCRPTTWKCTWRICSEWYLLEILSLNMTQVDASSFLSVKLPSPLDIRALSGYQPVSFSRLIYNESLIL